MDRQLKTGALRNYIEDGINGSRDLASSVMETVGDILACSYNAADDQPTIYSTTDVVYETLESTIELGSNIGQAARGLASAIVKYAHLSDRDVIKELRDLGGSLIYGAEHLGGDTSTAVRGFLEGAIDALRSIDHETKQTASKLAASLVQAAYEINEDAGDDVKNSLKGTIAGIDMDAKAA